MSKLGFSQATLVININSANCRINTSFQRNYTQINQEKCGVSRDDNNQLHIVSAVCTHMKGIVNWNNAEKTWDCPCHGSRFTALGDVIEGPAIMNLNQKHTKE